MTVRPWAERNHDIVRRTELDTGGHFLAMEVPDRSVGDVGDFLRAPRWSDPRIADSEGIRRRPHGRGTDARVPLIALADPPGRGAARAIERGLTGGRAAWRKVLDAPTITMRLYAA
ncbi:hypothetical protein [Embleya hyalina]|uniref:hypothetical protein n=1 Tax=Embleya hyalina TaxID=516124 RepID=UPI0015835614|nr:hypothetical protein [Embleya hyalina]